MPCPSNSVTDPASPTQVFISEKFCICNPGFETAVTTSGLNCALCPPGTYQPGHGQTICRKCKLGQSSLAGATECFVCPKTGASCVDGSPATLLPDFWYEVSDGGGYINASTNIFPCLSTGVCFAESTLDGRSVPECAEGHKGPLCSLCVEGWAHALVSTYVR